MFLGQNVWPVARSRTENTRKTPKNTFKKGHKMVKNQNFEKLLKKCLDIDLKIIFSKHYVPMPKTFCMRWRKSIKSSKIVKNGPQIVKNKNFQKIFFFCFFYVIMSLHAKNCACRSSGVACGQYKDKEEKTLKKVKKGHKNVKNENFEKRKKTFFPIVLKNIFSKN